MSGARVLGPMSLIGSLMRQQSEVLKGPKRFIFPEERWGHWLQRYTYYIEREVVSRVLKMPSQSDADDLISEIRQDILTDNILRKTP